MWKKTFKKEQSKSTSKITHGRKAVRVFTLRLCHEYDMWQTIYAQRHPGEPHENPHGRETLRMYHMWKKI